ncbi:MAG: phosphonate ABC transporter ATP-binding protein [Candidatus Rokubacteria bacterium]|nr:phosphonate ABC transporter ATP-binding protein [Candidatus Rokubacteria bacterium]
MYELSGIRKTFDGSDVALENVSLTIGRGEQVAFIGPSGAGKTTLFRILNLTLRPTAGTLRVGGVDASDLDGAGLRALRRRIGTVYQQHNLVGRLRVVHNVLAGHLGRWSTTKAVLSLLWPREVETAAEALGRVGIPEKLYARTDTLSGGQQQRVAIARVLVQDPEVILGDEPVSSVDPSLAASIVRLLKDLSRAGRKTLLMNLHSVDVALTFFPRIVGVREGRVAFDLAPDKVTPDLLGGLYAGTAPEDAPIPAYDGVHPISRVCRPTPDLE